jgi:hypothetical protein
MTALRAPYAVGRPAALRWNHAASGAGKPDRAARREIDRRAPASPADGAPAANGALTQNSIVDMLQDRSGLMWFATLGGVDVFDGYRFRSITSDPRDPDSLSGVLVADLYEDRDGSIWIGGFLGWLDRLDPRTGRISHLPREIFGAPTARQSSPTWPCGRIRRVSCGSAAARACIDTIRAPTRCCCMPTHAADAPCCRRSARSCLRTTVALWLGGADGLYR